jgi:hypothetical protein
MFECNIYTSLKIYNLWNSRQKATQSFEISKPIFRLIQNFSYHNILDYLQNSNFTGCLWTKNPPALKILWDFGWVKSFWDVRILESKVWSDYFHFEYYWCCHCLGVITINWHWQSGSPVRSRLRVRIPAQVITFLFVQVICEFCNIISYVLKHLKWLEKFLFG